MRFLGYISFLKPKQILARFLIFLIVALLVFQTTLGIVFYNNHWVRSKYALVQNLALDFSAILSVNNYLAMEEIAKKLNLPLQKVDGLPNNYKTTKLTGDVKDIQETLASSLEIPVYVDGKTVSPHILVYFVMKDGTVLRSYVSNRRFSTSSPSPFFGLILVVSLIFLLASFLVFRLQFRPLVNLAVVANKFGKGIDVPDLKQTGSHEMRLLAKSFNIMKNRIRRHIQQRMVALAAISHDLRTPLTRMRLQLSLMPQNEEIKNVISDVDEMKIMLDEYLIFVKNEAHQEVSTEVNAKNYLQSFMKRSYPGNEKINILNIPDDIQITVKPFSFSRCLSNIINNALNVGTKIDVSLVSNKNEVNIYIDDNGPGVPKNKRKDVFRPFYRIDPARNLNTKGSVGLGLTIAQDIVHAHGGNIVIEDSPSGGARINITLPY